MDFKKFGTIVLILGLLIFSYGCFQWITNQPKKFNPAESGRSIFGGRDDLGNMLNVQTTNLVRSGKREGAIKILVTGGIVAFIGLGISCSAKRKT
jgi:hypothetical protein